jgi:O-antigen/teichoic acid export membrane protein
MSTQLHHVTVSATPKYERLSLRGNIATTFAARMALLGLAFVSSIMLARLLGPEGRGVLALVCLLPDLGSILGRVGFDSANAVFAGIDPTGRRALVWQSVGIGGVVGGAMALAGAWYVLMGAPGFPTLIHGPLAVYLLALSLIPLVLVNEYWKAIVRGMNCILTLNLLEVGATVLGLVLLGVLVGGFGLGVWGAVWANTAIAVIALVVMAWFFRRTGMWGKPTLDRDLAVRSAAFALPAYGGTILAYLNYRVDEFFIAAWLPPAQLGFYVMAVLIVERLWTLPGAIATVLLPHITNSSQRDPVLTGLIARHTAMWTSVASGLIFVFADPLIRLVYSPAFADVVAPLRWLLPGVVALGVGKVIVTELLARRKAALTAYASGTAALVNIACNLVLVPQMGISGAALASTISYSLLSALLVRYYVVETGVPWTVLVPRRDDLAVYGRLWRDGIGLRRHDQLRRSAPATVALDLGEPVSHRNGHR